MEYICETCGKKLNTMLVTINKDSSSSYYCSINCKEVMEKFRGREVITDLGKIEDLVLVHSQRLFFLKNEEGELVSNILKLKSELSRLDSKIKYEEDKIEFLKSLQKLLKNNKK